MPTFSLLTFNCYGVPTPGTSSRLRLLAHHLNALDMSAVCLQEVQSNRHRRLFERECATYPEHAYKPFIHAPKGGLMTFSRSPIVRTEFILYDERGLWYTPALTDWILHKGILITHLAWDHMPVILINTHLTANYMGDWSRTNPFAKHEYNQLHQLAECVRAQPTNALVLVCGDFNIPRGSWMYEAFLEESGLTDPLSGNLQPTLRPRMILPSRYIMPIDYALLRAPQTHGVKVESRFQFEDMIPHKNKQVELSDHYAVELLVNVSDRRIETPDSL
jgi:endonuclease/exonuclease/phosphatase family metal-dependent hydrolase